MKKRIILLVFLFFTCLTAFSQNKKNTQQQDTTPVQLQNLSGYEKREVEKQHQKLLDQNAKEFNDGDETFKPNTIPDKWKNESAVIIGQKAEYDYYPVTNGAACDEVVRRKIMLLDKAAVDKFTTMTFIPNQEVGYRIIKKNGTIKNINTLTAQPIQDNYKGTGSVFFIPVHYNVPVTRYYKLAIPDLEPGDIFEYYYVNTYTYHEFYVPGTSVQMYRYGIPFPAIIFTLDEEYPIVKQREEFNIQKGFYVNYTATNGAPKFSQPEVVDKKTKLFAITDENREKKKEERWKYDFRSDPTIKFQVVYTTESGKDEMPYMLGDPFVPVTSVPHELLQGVANQIAIEKMDVSTKVAEDVMSYMHKNYKKLDDSVKYMKLAYYYLRYYMYVKKRKQYEANDYNSNNIEALDFKNFLPDNREEYVSDEFFIKTMGIIARNVGLQDEMIFGVPRDIGTLDNLVLRGEMQWLTKIRGVKDILMYPCNGFSNPDEPMGEMEGTHDYSIIPNEKSAKVIMKETTIPISPYSNNVSSFKLDATLNSAMEGSVSVARKANIKGLQKSYYYPDVLIQEQYEDQEAKKFGDQTESEYIDHLSAKKKDAEVKSYNDYLNDEKKKRLDIMADKVKEEYKTDGYSDFNLTCSGIEMDSTTLIFNDAFKVKDLVKKVGPNYTMQVGELIGAQTELNGDDSVRKSDIFFSYAREIDNEVDLNIPAGYKVDGVNALNMNVTNGTGGFVSTANILGSKLVITTKKYYTSNYQPLSSWPDMEKFIHAAYDFTQKKILLKKG